MNRRRLRFFWLVPFMAALLACQSVTRLWQPATSTPPPAPTRESSSTPLPLQTHTPLPTAVPSATFAPSPTATLSPTPTLTFIPVTPTPLPLSLQLDIFEELWQIIRNDYLYSDFNGLDWDAIHSEYRLKVEAGLSNENFYLALDEMIFRLGDEHSTFLSPEEVAAEDAEYEGSFDYVGIGVLVAAVPERGRATILVTFPGSPAEQAGLQARDSILTVDGQSILDEDGFLRDIIRGPDRSLTTLLVQTPGQQPRQVTITRQRITGAIPVNYQTLSTPLGKRIGYLLLVSFADSTVDEHIGDALRAMSADGPLDGLIIDNRPNGGGADTVLRPALGYFTSGTLGHFISRQEERPLIVTGEDIAASQSIPLVVLVGPETVSYGEVFAGVLQDTGRAFLIGETTLGNVETLWGYDFDDGSRAWIAHESFRPVNNPASNWEETGVIPDLTILAGWDLFTFQDDPAIQAALSYLDEHE